MAQIAHVYAMAGDAEEGEERWETVDEGQEDLKRNDGVDESSK